MIDRARPCPVADPELGNGEGGLEIFLKIFLNGGPNYFFTPFFPKIYPFFKKLTFFWISMGGASTPCPSLDPPLALSPLCKGRSITLCISSK